MKNDNVFFVTNWSTFQMSTNWLAGRKWWICLFFFFFGSKTLVWMTKVGFVFPKSVHNLNPHLELQNAGGPCQVIVSRWETHQMPRSLSPSGIWSQNSAHVSNEIVDSVLHAYYILNTFWLQLFKDNMKHSQHISHIFKSMWEVMWFYISEHYCNIKWPLFLLVNIIFPCPHYFLLDHA